MPEPDVDLAELFGSVTEALNNQKDSLNEADSHNHDHGDHMVENFRLITEALQQKQDVSPAEQLAYASQQLSQSSSTGSAQIYSQGLTKAAEQLQGQPTVTAENAMSLVQSLLGAGEVEAPFQPVTRGATSAGTPLGNLLSAGSAYMQAKQEGASSVEAFMKAYMAGSQMSQSSHQSQSGQIVGGTLIDALSTILGGKKTKPKPRPKSASRRKPKAKVKPKSTSKTKTKPKPKSASKPKAKPKPKSASKPKPKTKPTSEK